LRLLANETSIDVLLAFIVLLFRDVLKIRFTFVLCVSILLLFLSEVFQMVVIVVAASKHSDFGFQAVFELEVGLLCCLWGLISLGQSSHTFASPGFLILLLIEIHPYLKAVLQMHVPSRLRHIKFLNIA
jgi:hypothetical protein